MSTKTTEAQETLRAAIAQATETNKELAKSWQMLRYLGADEFTIKEQLKQTWQEPVNLSDYAIEISQKGVKLVIGSSTFSGTKLINLARSSLGIQIPDEGGKPPDELKNYLNFKAEQNVDVLLIQKGTQYTAFHKEGVYVDGALLKDTLGIPDAPVRGYKQARKTCILADEIEVAKEKLLQDGLTVGIASLIEGKHVVSVYPEPIPQVTTEETPDSPQEEPTPQSPTEETSSSAQEEPTPQAPDTPDPKQEQPSPEPEVEKGLAYLQEVREEFDYLPDDTIVMWSSINGILTQEEEEAFIAEHTGKNILIFLQSHAEGTNMEFVANTAKEMRQGDWNWYAFPRPQVREEVREDGRVIWRVTDGTKRMVAFLRELKLSLKYIPVELILGTYSQARLAAIAANQQHEQTLAQKRSNTTKRLNFLRTLLDPFFADKSQTLVAKHVGIAVSTTTEWLRNLAKDPYWVTSDPKEKFLPEKREEYKITPEQQEIIDKWLGDREIAIVSTSNDNRQNRRVSTGHNKSRSKGGGGGGSKATSSTSTPKPIQSEEKITITIQPQTVCVTTLEAKYAYMKQEVLEANIEGIYLKTDDEGNLEFVPLDGDYLSGAVTPESLRYLRELTEEERAKHFPSSPQDESSDSSATTNGTQSTTSNTSTSTQESGSSSSNGTSSSSTATIEKSPTLDSSAQPEEEYDEKLARLLTRVSQLEAQSLDDQEKIQKLTTESQQLGELNTVLIQIINAVKEQITHPDWEEEFMSIPEAEIRRIKQHFNSIYELVTRT
jgi:hypothetical protein